MRQQQQLPKVTKKVIIINQKSNTIGENNNLMNTQQQLTFDSEQKWDAVQLDQNQFSENQKYIQELIQLYQKNCAQLQEFQVQIQELKQRVQTIEERFQTIESSNRKKKKRRTAAEIEKNFKCPYLNCEKQYGSDVSLNLHIKFKHNGGNKSERQKIIKQLQAGEIEEKDVQNINLPPV